MTQSTANGIADIRKTAKLFDYGVEYGDAKAYEQILNCAHSFRDTAVYEYANKSLCAIWHSSRMAEKGIVVLSLNLLADKLELLIQGDK